jgi:hypothetical protein
MHSQVTARHCPQFMLLFLCALSSNGDVFLSRMEAQRNARDFSGTLISREQQLDTHVITALDGMTDAEYKQLQLRRGYSIHGHRYYGVT